MEGPDEPVFSGFRDAEILVASNKGQVFSELISSFDNQIDISKSKGEKEKTKSNPSFGQGSSSRVKIFMFDDYPIETLSRKKLPKVHSVMLNFFHHLISDEGRAQHNNKNTLATKEAVKNAAYKTCSEIRQVWAQHLTSKLVDIDQESKILIRDHRIVERITDFYKRYRALKQDSERKERASTQNFINKVSAYKDEVNKPMNILAKDWRENLKKAGIKDYKQDILHIENQMKDEQIGSLGSVDTHQVKKDKRNDQETTRKEKAEAKSAAEKHFFDQNADIEVEESYSDKENNNDSDFDCPGSQKPKRRKVNVMKHVSVSGLARGVSIRNQTVIAAATARALGWDLDDTNISVSSTKYHNKKTLEDLSRKIREDLEDVQNVSLHFDGALLAEKGSYDKYNRIAVIVKSIDAKNEEKIVSIPKTQDGSGFGEANCVIEALQKFNIKTGIKSCLSSFVGEGSWLLFDICGVETKPEWLLIPSKHWETFEDFRRMKEFAENLPVTNDTAERGMALIKTYIDKVCDESDKQDLIQLVANWRKAVPSLNKSVLQTL